MRGKRSELIEGRPGRIGPARPHSQAGNPFGKRRIAPGNRRRLRDFAAETGRRTGRNHRFIHCRKAFSSGMAPPGSCGAPHPGARAERHSRHGSSTDSGLSFLRFTERARRAKKDGAPPGSTAFWMDSLRLPTNFKRRSPAGIWRNRHWPLPTLFCWEPCRAGRRCCVRAPGRGISCA